MQIKHFREIMLSVGPGTLHMNMDSFLAAKRLQNQLIEARQRCRDFDYHPNDLPIFNSIVVSVKGNNVILETASSIRKREAQELEDKIGHKDERATTQS